MKVSHIAGLPVCIDDKGIQRCAWCGHVLFEVEYSAIMVPNKPDGSPGEGPRPWTMGDFVEVEVRGNVTTWAATPNDPHHPMPENWCGGKKVRKSVPPPAQKAN